MSNSRTSSITCALPSSSSSSVALSAFMRFSGARTVRIPLGRLGDGNRRLEDILRHVGDLGHLRSRHPGNVDRLDQQALVLLPVLLGVLRYQHPLGIERHEERSGQHLHHLRGLRIIHIVGIQPGRP